MSEKDMRRIFAKNLNQLLIIREKTQSDIVRDLKFNQSTVSSWMSGNMMPRPEKLEALAQYLHVSVTDLLDTEGIHGNDIRQIPIPVPKNIIPVLGSIPAGTPVDMVQDIQGYIDISESADEYGALVVSGRSMYPQFIEGDIIIFHAQPICESGDICVIRVNQNDACLKKVIINDEGVLLQPLNPEYNAMFFPNGNDIEILGVVTEIRRKL